MKLIGPVAQVSEVHDWVDDDDHEPEATYDGDPSQSTAYPATSDPPMGPLIEQATADKGRDVVQRWRDRYDARATRAR